jgi:hypothetical protein
MHRERFGASSAPRSDVGDDEPSNVCTIRDALILPCICANCALRHEVKVARVRSNAIMIGA